MSRRDFLKGPLKLVHGVVTPSKKETYTTPAKPETKELAPEEVNPVVAELRLMRELLTNVVQSMQSRENQPVSLPAIPFHQIASAASKIMYQPDEEDIKIDESIVVTEVKLDMQKGFDNLASLNTTSDKNMSETANKLKALKKKQE